MIAKCFAPLKLILAYVLAICYTFLSMTKKKTNKTWKEETAQVYARLPVDMVEELRTVAYSQHLSINKLVSKILTAALKRWFKK